MASNRVYYAVQRATLCPAAGSTNNTAFTTAGFVSNLIQSVGITTSLEYEQLFELGRLQIFENVEGLPSIEVTLERAIGVYSGANSTTLDAFTEDGTLWNICANSSPGGAKEKNQFTNAAGRQFNVNMTTADDNSSNVVGSVSATGMYLSNYSLNFAVEGPATESVTLVGNSCEWGSGLIRKPSKAGYLNDVQGSTDGHDGSASGIIQRKHVTGGSVGTGGLQSLSFTVSFDREDLLTLGSKYPYFKATSFPVETSLELEYIAGKNSSGFNFTESDCNVGANIEDADIEAGNRTFHFGDMNWTGTSKSGGDAGGGNQTITQSYVGYNQYNVSVNTAWTNTVNVCEADGYTA
jgi:hypothetical protein